MNGYEWLVRQGFLLRNESDFSYCALMSDMSSS